MVILIVAHQYAMKLEAFLNAATFFSVQALSKGYWIRGAFSYGLFHQEKGVVIGEPLMEAVEKEKKANYPRIVLSKSFIEEINNFSEQHRFGWDRGTTFSTSCLKKDNIDSEFYFDYLTHYQKLHPSYDLDAHNFLMESVKRALEKIDNELKLIANIEESGIRRKLEWLKEYLEDFRKQKEQVLAIQNKMNLKIS